MQDSQSCDAGFDSRWVYQKGVVEVNDLSIMQKKSPEELEQYLQFKRRGFKVPAKKGKGSFKRNPKHRNGSLS